MSAPDLNQDQKYDRNKEEKRANNRKNFSMPCCLFNSGLIHAT
jgi:hypothetical protein